MHPLGFDCASSSRLMTAILLQWLLKNREITSADSSQAARFGFFLYLYFFDAFKKLCAALSQQRSAVFPSKDEEVLW